MTERRTISNSLLFLLCIAVFLLPGCHREKPEEKYKRLVSEAKVFSDKKQFNEARLKLLSAAEIQPDVAQTYYDLAEAYVHLKKIREAFEYYQTTLNHDPSHREARLRLAALFLAANRLDEAEDHTRKLLEKNADDSEALVVLANIRAAQTKYDEARKILEGVMAKNPEDVASRVTLASIELSTGNDAKAEKIFQDIVKEHPDNGAVQLALADLYTRQGHFQEAQEIMESMVNLYPDQTGLHYRLAEFLLKRGLVDKAVEQYQATLKTDPLRHDARDRLYDIYVGKQEKEKAIALVDDLRKVDAKDPVMIYFDAKDKELAGKREEALQDYMKALEALPTFAPAFRRAGVLEMSLSNRQQAIEHLNQAIAIDPDDLGARLALAQDAFQHKDFAQASAHVQRVLSQFPNQLAANLLRADLALVQGDKQLARTIYEIVLQAFPKNALGHLKLGILEESEKNFDKARDHYRTVIDFDNSVGFAAQRLAQLTLATDGAAKAKEELLAFREKSVNSRPDLDLVLGSLELAQGKTPEHIAQARSYFQSALEGRPDHAGAYYALARLDAMENKLDEAIGRYQEIIAKDPQQTTARMLLAVAYEQEQKFEDAATAYRGLLQISPRFAAACNNLAWLLIENLHRDSDDALRLAQIAKEEMPDDPSVTDTLGWVYFRRDTPRSALPILQDALELAQRGNTGTQVSPIILYHIGEVQHALGDDAGAVGALGQALTTAEDDFPYKGRIRERLKEIPKTGGNKK